MLCLAPEIVQKQQKQAEYVCLLRHFQVPLITIPVMSRAVIPFSGHPREFLVTFFRVTSCGDLVVTRIHQMLQVYLEGENPGTSSFCYSCRIQMALFNFFLIHSWLFATKVMITSLAGSSFIISLQVLKISPFPPSVL